MTTYRDGVAIPDYTTYATVSGAGQAYTSSMVRAVNISSMVTAVQISSMVTAVQVSGLSLKLIAVDISGIVLKNDISSMVTAVQISSMVTAVQISGVVAGAYTSGATSFFTNIGGASSGQYIKYDGTKITAGAVTGGSGYVSGDSVFFGSVVATGTTSAATLEVTTPGNNLIALMMLYGG